MKYTSDVLCEESIVRENIKCVLKSTRKLKLKNAIHFPTLNSFFSRNNWYLRWFLRHKVMNLINHWWLKRTPIRRLVTIQFGDMCCGDWLHFEGESRSYEKSNEEHEKKSTGICVYCYICYIAKYAILLYMLYCYICYIAIYAILVNMLYFYICYIVIYVMYIAKYAILLYMLYC